MLRDEVPEAPHGFGAIRTQGLPAGVRTSDQRNPREPDRNHREDRKAKASAPVASLLVEEVNAVDGGAGHGEVTPLSTASRIRCRGGHEFGT
jgi:hypothetical protein